MVKSICYIIELGGDMIKDFAIKFEYDSRTISIKKEGKEFTLKQKMKTSSAKSMISFDESDIKKIIIRGTVAVIYLDNSAEKIITIFFNYYSVTDSFLKKIITGDLTLIEEGDTRTLMNTKVYNNILKKRLENPRFIYKNDIDFPCLENPIDSIIEDIFR